MASCKTPVAEGMTVITLSDRLLQVRQDSLKALLVNHPLDCPICDKAGECMLQDLVYEHGITNVEMQPPTSKFTSAYTHSLLKIMAGALHFMSALRKRLQ